MSSTDTELTDLVLDIIDRKQDPQDRMDTIQGILEDDMNRGQMIKLLSVLAETYAKQEKFIETVVTYSALAIFRQKGDKPSEKEIKERCLIKGNRVIKSKLKYPGIIGAANLI